MNGAPGRDDGEVMREVREAWTELLSAARQAGYAVSELVRPPATARPEPPARTCARLWSPIFRSALDAAARGAVPAGK